MEEKITLENLRPVCKLCNGSMGKKNMEDFMKKYKLKKPENWNGCSLKGNYFQTHLFEGLIKFILNICDD